MRKKKSKKSLKLLERMSGPKLTKAQKEMIKIAELNNPLPKTIVIDEPPKHWTELKTDDDTIEFLRDALNYMINNETHDNILPQVYGYMRKEFHKKLDETISGTRDLAREKRALKALRDKLNSTAY